MSDEKSANKYLKKSPKLTYEVLFWIIFYALTIPWILDRFLWFLWPRQNFNFSFGTGNDRESLKDGPFFVKFYDVMARISGRWMIFGTNALFFTMMHTTHARLESSRFLNRFINFNDETARRRIHIILGWKMCILVLIHVWSILFPAVFHGWNVKVWAGYFTPLLSEQTPKGFKDADVVTQTMTLQVDDVYRLALMSIILGPLMWLSYKKLASNYRIGILLHQFIFIMFFIDLVRRHSHPHCWFINFPAALMLLIDKLWLAQILKHETLKMNVFHLSNDYCIFYWKTETLKQTGKKMLEIAKIYNVRTHSASKFERQHPFTTFQNRGMFDKMIGKHDSWMPATDDQLDAGILNLKNPEMMTKIDAKMSDNKTNWNIAFVCRVYHNPKSHTLRLRNDVIDDKKIDSWAAHSALAVYHSLVHETKPLILISGGSGLGYVLDVMSYIQAHFSLISCKKITLVLSTYDLNLFMWFLSICQAMKLDEIQNLEIDFILDLTCGKSSKHGVKQISSEMLTYHARFNRKLILGRLDFDQLFREKTQRIGLSKMSRMTVKCHATSQPDKPEKYGVFCHGGEALTSKVFSKAEKYGCQVHKSVTFS